MRVIAAGVVIKSRPGAKLVGAFDGPMRGGLVACGSSVFFVDANYRLWEIHPEDGLRAVVVDPTLTAPLGVVRDQSPVERLYEDQFPAILAMLPGPTKG